MKKTNIRKAAVAGQFYPSSKEKLKREIEGLVKTDLIKIDAIACILPHAGYIYSGKVAGETISHINIKNKIILIGPNHTGYGSEFSIMTSGIWQTPLGEIKIDNTLANQLLINSKHLEEDELAHLYEHSLEVELPFLQYFREDFEIIPITIASDRLEALKSLGKEIGATIENIKESVLIVASSDMTHYEPQKIAEKKDQEAIQAILELDEDKLFKKVKDLDISMCGYAPVIVIIAAAKYLKAKSAKLIKYLTSADTTKDQESVVGYAGLIIS